jgi:hypothetical protein
MIEVDFYIVLGLLIRINGWTAWVGERGMVG